jgi:hypothetical protein
MMKYVIQIAALALGALSLSQAMAHGAGKPLHGGIVQVVKDVSFELVAEADGASLYLVDHGAPMSSKGVTGTLTVLQGSHKTEVDLKEAGDNKLRASGVKLGKGDKIVAVLSNIDGKTATVRFTLK